MSWFDVVLIVLSVGLVALEMRREAGHALLDTVAALGAYRLTSTYDAPLTRAFGLPGMADSHASPLVQCILFCVLLALGLLVSRFLHKHSGWSMDRFDPVFGVAFGLVLAGVIGHTLSDVTARMTMRPNGREASFMAQSSLAQELRTFSAYHGVIRTLDNSRYHAE